KGTTLGADNGIGVASIMTLLASNDIAHPALEALFTIDEETGMTGALALKGGLLDGKILLNLDTEEDNELTIGCAGGVDVTANGTYSEETPKHKTAFRIAIKGLTGGHSGVDIHKGRGNANKLMNRLLFELTKNFDIQVASVDGGSLRNAIPRESVADVVVADDKVVSFKKAVSDYNATVKNENSFTDPNLNVTAESITTPAKVWNTDFQNKLLRAIYACPNGIYRMTPAILGLVQTSNNVARVLVKDGSYTIQCLTRSSVNSEKTDLAQAITGVFELAGATITLGGAYPGWEPKPDAPIVKLMSDLYKERYNEPANVDAIHAGLECGILGTNYPGMQMISFGPNIFGAHSPDERVQISSVQKYWGYLLE
ncbi:MAG TPA: beta-Ala-His dipeptidase, partial [Bacteroidia bacterium]|nr:beta-Ala-His dipeptidase [Bacteroidia bacterium]